MSPSRPHEDQSSAGFEFSDAPSVIRQFLGSIKPLQLAPREIKGDIFVIGHGQAFPERSLLCLPDDSFTAKLRQEISSVVTAEPNQFSNPGMMIDEIEVVSKSFNDPPEQKTKKIEYYQAKAGPVLAEWPEKVQFDTVLMFRIPQLDRELRTGLLANLAKHVRPGGRFICSGSHATDQPVMDPHWQVERLVVFPNADPTGFFYAGKNLGVVYRRLP